MKIPRNYLDEAYVSLLNCADESSGKIVGILLSCFDVKRKESEFVRIYPDELLFIAPEENQPSAGDRTTIFAKLAEIYDPKAVNMEVQSRHLSQERTASTRSTQRSTLGVPDRRSEGK